MPSDHRDVRRLFATRIIRLFAYGCISLILFIYLAQFGFSDRQIGFLLSMTLVGDTAISLWLTTSADRLGRKRVLIAGSALMVLGGLVFAWTGNFWILLAAATVGVISPSGNEVGPFLAVEQAALAQTVSAETRTWTFAWYNLVGSLATAGGSLVCGYVVQGLARGHAPTVEDYRIVLYAYVFFGMVLALVFAGLSQASEASPITPGFSRFLGLHRSRNIVLRLAALFALDAFAGGLIIQSLVAFWFHVRFGAEPRTLGTIFFGANLLAGVSALAAAALARRIGLLNTMVFTHVPSNGLLILIPFMPTLASAVAVLFLRFSISQMDVPARQSYTATLVSPDERSAAAGITGVARTVGAALSPAVAGIMLSTPGLTGGPFIAAGILKLVYDGLLYLSFRRVKVE
jgi:MFS family permease